MTAFESGFVESRRSGLDRCVMRELQLWDDRAERDGWTNMAVDEWLLETVALPTLRIYRWEPDWGSYGYFVRDADAAAALPGLRRVRRWTGGGIVDHRNDWTYTLVVPGREGLAGAKGAESYRVIHAALAEALRKGGVDVGLAESGAVARGGECFLEPVEFDLTDASGRKLAGAGQRRSNRGLLHQGSFAGPADGDLGRRLAEELSDSVTPFTIRPEMAAIEKRARSRYRDKAWCHRR